MDTLWTGSRFPVGYEGYFYAAAQGSQYVTPTTVTDPSPKGSLAAIGPCALPGWEQNENMRPVEGIGSGRVLSAVPGRRECSLSTRIDVCDPAFLTTTGNFVRDHASPSGAGKVNGMNLLLCEIGFPSAYPEDAWAVRGVDCLAQSLRLEIAEMQNVTADVELWPICFVRVTPPASAPPPSSCVPMIWQTISLVHNGIDYLPGLAGISIGVNNNLERVGSRRMLPVGGSPEFAISRTPVRIKPKLEQLTVSYRWHTIPPVALWSVFNAGQVVITAAQPGTGSRAGLRITLSNNYMSRVSGQQAQANAMFSASSEMLAHAITIEKVTLT
jgi:hypothetical protein